jgi:hypothetical protein
VAGNLGKGGKNSAVFALIITIQRNRCCGVPQLVAVLTYMQQREASVVPRNVHPVVAMSHVQAY